MFTRQISVSSVTFIEIVEGMHRQKMVVHGLSQLLIPFPLISFADSCFAIYFLISIIPSKAVPSLIREVLQCMAKLGTESLVMNRERKA